jgi:hypothetical protein
LVEAYGGACAVRGGDDAAQAVLVVVAGLVGAGADEGFVGAGAVGVAALGLAPALVFGVGVLAVVYGVGGLAVDEFDDPPAAGVVAVFLRGLAGLFYFDEFAVGVPAVLGDDRAGAGAAAAGDCAAFAFAGEVAVGVIEVGGDQGAGGAALPFGDELLGGVVFGVAGLAVLALA